MTINLTGNVARIYGRGKLLSILEKDVILTRVKVISNDRFILKSVDWDSYWQPLYQISLFGLEVDLDKLHSSWISYIHSRFNPAFQKDYCYYYFLLLNRLISNFQKDDYLWSNALHTTLGFECFGITGWLNEEITGAATCTLRNPCYLLAKLKMPAVLNDAQFLPVITVSDTKKPELFTHYRQYTVSRDSKMSILLYPITSDENRSPSFRLLNTLAGIIRYDVDPWTDERAKLLYTRMIKNIVQTVDFSDNDISYLEFVDLGAGSGSLVSKFCQQTQKERFKSKSDLKFRVWSIDLEPADPSRFFRAGGFRKSIDMLTYIGDDYRSWLSQPQPLPKTNGLRIAIVSKLLNVFSKYSFLQLSCEELHQYWPALPSSANLYTSLPQYCLAFDGKGPQSLVISNSRLISERGKIYPLLSLSDYYQGICILTNMENSIFPDKESYYLPLRSFDIDCLIASNGKSIISSLVDNCNYIVIEDADIRKQDLINHCVKHSLDFLTIRDMTKALKLKGNYLYVIWSKNNMTPEIGGEQIW